MALRLSDIDDEFQRGVFLAVYQSRRQRHRRLLAALVLLTKHMARGLLIIWPAYLVLLAGLLFPQVREYLWYFLALAPGLLVWLLIYLRGARLEYRQSVHGFILDKGFIKQLMFQ